jgi:hypothetical protein
MFPANAYLLAAKGTLAQRLGGCVLMVGIGALLILAGVNNIKTKSAEETGKRRIVSQMIGRNTSYEGRKAVSIGYMRVICGAGMILFGIAFGFVGPVLSQ